VNVVVANAGISGPSLADLPPQASFSEFRTHIWNWDTQYFNETFAVNVGGVFNTVAAFLELLDAGNKRGNLKQRSQVIATSSIGAFNRSPLLGYAYGGSKAAVVHIFKQLSTSLGPYDIRANVIVPGCKCRFLQILPRLPEMRSSMLMDIS
jgi:NAD(P)-dependent dehydrogenase (short-subunit alcohol dehydrogenase family)